MRPITWLHISDIHLRPREAWAQDVVLRAMCDDIAARRASLAPDFVLVTGDLAFSGKAAEYDIAAGFFDALIAASGVPKERIYCIPGNHDINRERQRMAFIGTRATLQDQNRTDIFLDPASREDLTTLLLREEGYRAFQASYFAGQDRAVTDDGLAYVARLLIEDVRLAIVALDSAWLAEGGVDDHGKLLIGERQVINALRLARERGDPPHVVLAMSHHPLHILHEFDRRPAQAHIERNCHFLHCGHLHDPEQRSAGSGPNGCLTVAAGASFETRHTRNSYTSITLNLLRARRSVTTIHYNHHDATFAAAPALEFPIEVQPSGTCSVSELAAALAAFDQAAAAWPHYFAALLLDQKAEIPISTATGYAFGSFAVMEAAVDSDLQHRTAAFKAFRNALRVLYQRIPLPEILRTHGQAVAQYGAALATIVEANPTLGTRLRALEADARALAAVEPVESFSHTVAMLDEIASTGDWGLLREQAERHLDSPSPPVALAARRRQALALANGTERAEKEAAAALYQDLSRSEVFDQTDFGNLALLLVEIGDQGRARDALLSGIAACGATSYLMDIGHKIVEETGDRAFRKQLEAALSDRTERE
jgi:3',5'-cyclic AMP phosphodiesterase CpdA